MIEDKIVRKILNIIQDEIPVSRRPFKLIGDNIGMAEREVIKIIKKMKTDGFIRRIGGNFDLRKIGYATTLVGIKAPENKINKIAGTVCKLKEVTHCYKRTDEFNLWFTLNSSSGLKLNKLIDKIRVMTKIRDVLDLRAVRIFKLKLNFRV